MDDDEVEPGEPVMMVMIVVTTMDLWLLLDEVAAGTEVWLADGVLDCDAELDDEEEDV